MADIVANKSKAYGYNYASLGDIAQQGFQIPKMKTGTEDGKEYVFYYDAELKEWIRGALVVVPEMKGMNTAQQYGSALTYARRYTTLMALSLACDDDKKLEATAPKGQNLWDGLEDKGLKDLADEFRQLYDKDEQERILKGLNLNKAEEIGKVDLQKYINFKKYGKKQTN
jgi:hypothetical protein